MAASRKRTAVIYARVSTQRQAEKDLSIPDQLDRMRAWCISNDVQIIGEYIEPGRSATSDNRPEFQRMMNYVMESQEKVDYIVVHSFSRAFRNADDMMHYVRQLKCKRTRLVSITQTVDETPIGQLMMLIYGFVDEMNSTENAKHVTRAMRKSARNGFFTGSKPPFGYKSVDTAIVGHDGFRKVLQVNDEEAEIVREIFDLYEGDKYGPPIGMKQIAKHLNGKSLYRGAKWRVQVIQRILSDEIYTGRYVYGERTHGKQTTDE